MISLGFRLIKTQVEGYRKRWVGIHTSFFVSFIFIFNYKYYKYENTKAAHAQNNDKDIYYKPKLVISFLRMFKNKVYELDMNIFYLKLNLL